jgi:asparagine synthase (glutamine-hydrolysing)
MCGIAGIVRHPDNQQFDLDSLIKASEALAHRGPDDEGYMIVSDGETIQLSGKHTLSDWTEAHAAKHIAECRKPFAAGLLHRRLSIIDIGAMGHQPMSDVSNRYWITYNGEIYNYKALRCELENKGYIFKTHTDTEVLLYAYIEWGLHCEEHLNGMWAFVIYDREQHILFASRDRVGVKPFYYVHHNNFLAFASEQHVFHKAGWLPFEVNKKAVFDFLYYDLLEHQSEGMFRHVMELPPAHHLTYELQTGKLHVERFYTATLNILSEKPDALKTLQYINDIKDAATASIQSHLQSDVPVGTCLSGGLDSSIIVSVINRMMNASLLHTGNTQHAFHASFEENSFNESRYAEEVVKNKSVTLHTVEPTSTELITDLEKFVAAQCLPVRSFSSYAQYRVMQLAKSQGIKVLLDGQGADELFGGYYRYIINYLNDAQQCCGTQYVKDLKKEIFPDKNSRTAFNKYHLKEWMKAGSLRFVMDALHPAHRFLNKDLFKYQSQYPTPQSLFKDYNSALYFDFFGTFLKELLYREDRNAMAHSIESRVPFADDLALSSLLFSIPGMYKMQHGISKYLLREAFRELIPSVVYERRDKLGFVSPNNKWMAELKDVWRSYVTADLGEYYHLKNFKIFIDGLHKHGNKPENYKTLKWLTFAVWLKVMKTT